MYIQWPSSPHTTYCHKVQEGPKTLIPYLWATQMRHLQQQPTKSTIHNTTTFRNKIERTCDFALQRGKRSYCRSPKKLYLAKKQYAPWGLYNPHERHLSFGDNKRRQSLSQSESHLIKTHTPTHKSLVKPFANIEQQAYLVRFGNQACFGVHEHCQRTDCGRKILQHGVNKQVWWNSAWKRLSEEGRNSTQTGTFPWFCLKCLCLNGLTLNGKKETQLLNTETQLHNTCRWPNYREPTTSRWRLDFLIQRGVRTALCSQKVLDFAKQRHQRHIRNKHSLAYGWKLQLESCSSGHQDKDLWTYLTLQADKALRNNSTSHQYKKTCNSNRGWSHQHFRSTFPTKIQKFSNWTSCWAIQNHPPKRSNSTRIKTYTEQAIQKSQAD